MRKYRLKFNDVVKYKQFNVAEITAIAVGLRILIDEARSLPVKMDHQVLNNEDNSWEGPKVSMNIAGVEISIDAIEVE